MFIAAPRSITRGEASRIAANTALNAMMGVFAIAFLVAAAPAYAQVFEAPFLCPEEGECSAPGEAPYDLSPWETEIALAFDTNGTGNRPAWPAPPNTLTLCAATDASSLTNCLNSGANRHITVAAGTYSGSWILNDDDVWLDMDNAATLSGGLAVYGANRVKVTGGNITTGNLQMGNVTDLLIQNVNMDLTSDNNDTVWLCNGSVLICQRVAIVDSTCVASGYCTYTGINTPGNVSDIIYANFDAHSKWFGTGSEKTNFRFMVVERLLVIDSHLRVSPVGSPPIRVHYGAQQVAFIGNIIDSNPGFAGIWIDTSAGPGTGGPLELHDIEDVYILGNTQYMNGTKIFDVGIDDSRVDGSTYDAGAIINVVVNDNHSVANTATSTIGGVNVTNGIQYSTSGNTSDANFSAFTAFTRGADH